MRQLILNPLSSILHPLSSIFHSLSQLPPQHLEDAAPVYSRDDLLAARFRVARVLPYQSASPPFISNLALAVFSGLLLVFAFPNWGLWSLGWVGTAPLIMALARERRFWRGLLLGWVTGLVFYAGSSHWVTYSMHNYGGIPLWISYLLMVALGLAMGSFTGLFGGLFSFAVKRLGGWAILSAPVVWAASEYARLRVTGVGWNALGYSQAFQPAVIQIARWGGVYLVSAVMLFAAASLVFALVYLEQRRGLVVLTLCGVVAIASVVYGESLRTGDQGPHSLAVAMIQPNIPIEGDWSDPAFVGGMLQRHIDLSEQAILEAATVANANGGRNKIDLVIWPESPMNFEYDFDPGLRSRLSEFTRQHQISLLIGTWTYPQGHVANAQIYNSAILISPAGEKVCQYDKTALMPFGEYVPARGWIPFMDRIPALVGDVTPGTSVKPIDVANARLGLSICFETTRPDLARLLRREGASTLVQISNESWFGPTSNPRQVLAQAVFRAVENNIELLRATNSGLSAKIDRFGLVTGETPSFDTATRVLRTQTIDDAAANSPTFYTRYGDVAAVTCVVMSVLLGVLAVARKQD
jgi:apolipoprotein N-acyltransferase